MSNEGKQNLILQIKELIGQGELMEACELLQQISDTGYLLHSNLVDTERRYALGVIADEVYKREKNKVGVAILDELKLVSRKKFHKNNQDGQKALVEDINSWLVELATQDGNSWKTLAKFILGKWLSFNESQSIGNRKWGRVKVGPDQSEFRIWGLFNLRPRNTKWIWIAWDNKDKKIVIVKEMNPNFEDRDNKVSSKLKWEITTYQKLKNAQVKGLLNIVDSGEKWFASSLEPYGSFRWQIVGGEEDISGSPIYTILRGEKGRKGLYQKVNDLKAAPNKENWPIYRSIFVQTLNVLAELHANNYVYRDLHRANILLSEYNEKSKTIRIKLCDFDSNRKIDGEEPPFYLDEQFKGPYIAPERLEKPDEPNEDATAETWQEYYSELEAYHGLPSSDVYAMAAIITNILLDKTNKVISGQELVGEIESKRNWRKDFKQMMLRSLAGKVQYKERPTATELAQFLAKTPYEAIEDRQPRRTFYLLIFLIALLSLFTIWVIFPSDQNDPIVFGKTGPEVLESGQLDWNNDKVYQIENDIYIKDGVLKIGAGTRVYVKGNYGIYVTRNARIEAIGEPEKPIVFTTNSVFDENLVEREYQHWKGITIYGKARINGSSDSTNTAFFDEFNGAGERELHYGGGDLENHSSGTLKYVRIEHAGYCRDDHTQFNALTLIGVGSGTTIEYFLALNSGDDGIEIIGGSVNLRRIICHNFEDDALDWEYGWSGFAQYIVASGGPLGVCKEYIDKPSRTGDSQKASSLFNIGNLDERDFGEGPKLKNITVYLRGDSLSALPFLRFESKGNLPVLQDVLLQGFTIPEGDTIFTQLSNALLLQFPESGDLIWPKYRSLNFRNAEALPPFDPANANFLIPTQIIPSSDSLIKETWFRPDTSNFKGAFKNYKDTWNQNEWGKLK